MVWRPGEKDGNRRVAFSDLVRGRNPYDPASRNQRSIADADPDRAPVIAGTSSFWLSLPLPSFLTGDSIDEDEGKGKDEESP